MLGAPFQAALVEQALPHDALAVLLTPPGRGAIASVLVRGSGAEPIVRGLLVRAPSAPAGPLPIRRIVVARFGSNLGEEVVVCRQSALDVLVHSHGGQAAAAAILDALARHGCRVQAWRDWARQSSADPIQAAALHALASARTIRVASILLDQHQGALAGELRAIRNLLEAADGNALVEAERRLRRLIDHWALGRRLTCPFRVVVAGQPNAGKSSLVNALAGYARSIVYDQPGTTRDLVTASTAIDGWPVELVDTAGLWATTDELQLAGIQSAQHALEAADLQLLVVDSSRRWTEDDDALLAAWPHGLLVSTKSDLPKSASGPLAPLNSPLTKGGLRGVFLRDHVETVVTSSKTGAGIDQLLSAISGRLVPNPPPAGAAVPFDNLQMEVIRAAHSELIEGRNTTAAVTLRALVPY